LIALKLPAVFIFIALISAFISMKYHDEDTPYSYAFGSGIKKGLIESEELYEASGMVASRSFPGNYWIINDSGNQNKLYLIDGEGNLVHSYRIDGTFNFDWEDIAIYTDPKTGDSKIYIGDIGDNFAIRQHVQIIVVDEPRSLDQKDTLIHYVSKLTLKYEDGARDAETLIVDPATSDIFVITKREENVRVYSPGTIENPADILELKYLSSLPFHNLTAGDITADGSEILLKNYNAIFYWKRMENESFPEAISKPHERLPYHPEPQGESIAWEINGRGFYTLSEKNPNKEQILYFYERK
jgi:hypothetical protein